MTTGRWVIETYALKQTCKSILVKARLLDENQTIVTSSYRFIHGLISYKNPSILYNKLIFPKRACNDVTFNFKGKTFLKSYINIGLRAYTKTPLVNINCKSALKQGLRDVVGRQGAALEIIRSART